MDKAESEYLINLKNINKSFYGVKVLNSVDLKVKKGEIHALCGENGAGKSTLMNIITGIYKKDEGKIIYKGEELKNLNPLKTKNIGIAKIHQELNLFENMTVADNINIGNEPLTAMKTINLNEHIERAKKSLNELEKIDPKKKVKDLSTAKKQIVEIAKALTYNAELLIMDEPTASLTQNETDLLFDLMEKLKEQGVTIIYISHKLSEVKRICDRVTVLRDGNIVDVENVDNVTEEQIAKMMVGREIRETQDKSHVSTKEEILRVENLTNDSVKNISFTLKKGEILGISGLVGMGRTELAETLFGLRNIDKGEIYIKGEKVKINSPSEAMDHGLGFLTEERKDSGLFLNRSVTENITITSLLKNNGKFIDKHQDREKTNNLVNKMNIKCESITQKLFRLSGGNQQKVVLGKWLAGDSEIIILDEPTRGVDIGAKEEIYEIINNLIEEGKSIIMISSDLPEILSIPHRILVMCNGKITGEFKSEEATEENIMICATGIQEGEI